MVWEIVWNERCSGRESWTSERLVVLSGSDERRNPTYMYITKNDLVIICTTVEPLYNTYPEIHIVHMTRLLYTVVL